MGWELPNETCRVRVDVSVGLVGWASGFKNHPSCFKCWILALLSIFDFHIKFYKNWTKTGKVAFRVVLPGVVGWAGGCKNQPSLFKLCI